MSIGSSWFFLGITLSLSTSSSSYSTASLLFRESSNYSRISAGRKCSKSPEILSFGNLTLPRSIIVTRFGFVFAALFAYCLGSYLGAFFG
jgi:hypothetical protein